MRELLRDYGTVIELARKLVGTKDDRELVQFFLGLVLTILIGNYGSQFSLEYVSRFTNTYVERLKQQGLLDKEGNPIDPEEP